MRVPVPAGRAAWGCVTTLPETQGGNGNQPHGDQAPEAFGWGCRQGSPAMGTEAGPGRALLSGAWAGLLRAAPQRRGSCKEGAALECWTLSPARTGCGGRRGTAIATRPQGWGRSHRHQDRPGSGEGAPGGELTGWGEARPHGVRATAPGGGGGSVLSLGFGAGRGPSREPGLSLAGLGAGGVGLAAGRRQAGSGAAGGRSPAGRGEMATRAGPQGPEGTRV